MKRVLFLSNGHGEDLSASLLARKLVDIGYKVDGLPIVGQEKVQLKFTDNNEETLDLTFYVNNVKPFYDDSNKSAVLLDLVSKEFIMNQKVRVSKRYDG